MFCHLLAAGTEPVPILSQALPLPARPIGASHWQTLLASGTPGGAALTSSPVERELAAEHRRIDDILRLAASKSHGNLARRSTAEILQGFG